MTTTLIRDDLPEEIYKKSKALNKEQVSQVLDFIEFLKLKEKKTSVVKLVYVIKITYQKIHQ